MPKSITKIGTKRLVSEDDEISYPFKALSPTRHFGQCLELQDEKPNLEQYHVLMMAAQKI